MRILKARNDELRQEVQELRKRLSDNNKELQLARAQLAMQASSEPSQSVPLIRRERPLPGHQFNLSMIATSIELAKRVGFRAAADVLGIVFNALGIDIDGASELREPAEKLEKDGEKTIVLGDLKHHAANVLEKEIGRGERFKSFINEVALTRNRVQQTELDQFAPPTLKSKSRFMNVGTLFRWAMMVLYHLDHPSVSREGICDERMEEKFAWLRQYAEVLKSWNQCQDVIDQTLRVINTMGLDAKTPGLVEEALDELTANWRQEGSSATRIGVKLIAWIEDSVSTLEDGQRAWLSTEILESLFGRFKQMERQHSKGGFTRLIAAIPAQCMRVTGARVREAFGRID